MNMRRKKNWKANLCRRLLLVVLGVLLGLSVYMTNARSLTRNQLPMPFGTGLAVVLSGSMEPTLRVGDLLVIRQEPDYYEGDIVVYQSGQELIVHRIISKDDKTCITQGDANNVEDSPISIDAIQGAVVGRVPALGRLISIIRTPIGMIIILAIAIGLIEGSFLKEKKSDDDELDAIKQEIRRLKEEQEKDK